MVYHRSITFGFSVLAMLAIALTINSCGGMRNTAKASPSVQPISGSSRDDSSKESMPVTIKPNTQAEQSKSEPPKTTHKSVPAKSPGVKAGWSDDNKQFNYFAHFLANYDRTRVLPLDISGRIIVAVTDAAKKPLPNCQVSFRDSNGRTHCTRKSYANGQVLFFPMEYHLVSGSEIIVQAQWQGKSQEQSVVIGGKSAVEIVFDDVNRGNFANVPLDIAFLLDTTSSMDDELASLKKVLDIINYQVSQLSSQPSLRLGAVLYRDRDEEYVTKVLPFTTDVEEFRSQMSRVTAEAGGDAPEDLQSGLVDTMQKLDWRADGIRLVFLIGDARPHIDYGQAYTYLDAMREAGMKGIKICSIGASGLDVDGEYAFRQIAQYTLGQFIFLTYGEKGESEGGMRSVSHHTGAQFQTRTLESIVIRIIKTELSYLTEQTVEDEEEYFEAMAVEGEKNSEILQELLRQAVQQLVDFSMSKIGERKATVMVPTAVTDEHLAAYADTLEDRTALTVARFKEFQLLERKNLKEVLSQMKLQRSALFDQANGVAIGKLANAHLAVIAKLQRGKGKLEMYLKLVRIETGEILSATLLRIEEKLL